MLLMLGLFRRQYLRKRDSLLLTCLRHGLRLLLFVRVTRQLPVRVRPGGTGFRLKITVNTYGKCR